MLSEGVYVAAGAALGALARALISAFLPAPSLSLLLINWLGCALMGYMKPGPFWGTGVLGGFTSFSSFILLIEPTPSRVLWAVAMVVGCVAAWVWGDRRCSA